MKDRKNLLAVGALFIIALVTRIINFDSPLGVVFDETYFLKFIGYYWDGTYFFDVHPPFARLLFVFFAYLIGVTPSADIGTIGTAIDPSLTLFRLLPIFIGSLLPVVIFAICRALKLSLIPSLAAGLFICLENSLIIQSRIVLTDMVLLVCGFLTLLFYLNYRNSHIKNTARIFLFLSALSFAATIGIKWTGLFYLAPIVGYELFDLFAKEPWVNKILKLARRVAVYVLVSAVLYVSLFAVHFALLPLTGPGENFMSAAFQKTLLGNKYDSTPSLVEPKFIDKFFELNIEMYRAHTRMTNPHNYASKYYTWPLMTRPMYYWYNDNKTEPPTYSRIYLIGNPVLYWGGAVAIVTMFITALWAGIRRTSHKLKNEYALFFILMGFMGSFLPFIFIGRVMFLYHYGPGLIFSIMGLAYLLDLIRNKKQQIYLTVACVVLCIALFAYFSPLTYGLPLTPDQYDSRVWFKTWM
jgi:dolichyl-phosphate-mannose-protein mannosyltransferase